MKKYFLILAIMLITYGVSIFLICFWYDWKLLIIFFIWTYGNNISNMLKLKLDSEKTNKKIEE